MGLGDVAVLDLFGADSAVDIVGLCDPRVKLDSEEDFVRSSIRDCLVRPVDRGGLYG